MLFSFLKWGETVLGREKKKFNYRKENNILLTSDRWQYGEVKAMTVLQMSELL